MFGWTLSQLLYCMSTETERKRIIITHLAQLLLRLTMLLNENSRFPRGSICRIWCMDTKTVIRNLFASILTHTDVRSRMHLDNLTWYRLHFITSCLKCKMYLDRLSSTNIAQVRSSTSCRYQASKLDLCCLTDVQCQWKQPTIHHELDSHYLH